MIAIEKPNTQFPKHYLDLICDLLTWKQFNQMYATSEMTYESRFRAALRVSSSYMENDVENALNNFHRDGFGKVVFYV